MQLDGCAVDADIGEMAARANQFGAQFEGVGDADSFDGDIGPEPVASSAQPPSPGRKCDRNVGPAANVAFCRALAGSTAMMYPGLNNRAVVIAASPIGPAPTTTTESPGRTLAIRTPTS